MASKNSKTVKEITYKKYVIKIKKDGECFIFYPNGKYFTWAEHINHAQWSINTLLRCQKTYALWDEEDKKKSA